MSMRGFTATIWALGGLAFSAILLVLSGIWMVFLGIGAIVRSGFFIVDPSYAYEFTVSVWGWIHLLLGIGMFVVGVALIGEEPWARPVGILAALLTAVAQFLFLPYYPIGSLVIILAAFFVIWSLTTTPYRTLATEPGPE